MMRIIFTVMLIAFGLQLKAQDIERLQTLYQEGKLSELIEEGKKLSRAYPENLGINYLLGRALTDTKNFEEAIPYLIKSSDSLTSPRDVQAWSKSCLGACYYWIDHYDKSKKGLMEAFKMNATQNSRNSAARRLKAFQMEELYDGWVIKETGHIRFHFQNPQDIPNIQAYCERREKALLEIDKVFNAQLHRKIEFFVWSNGDQAEKTLGRPLGFTNPELFIINSLIDQTLGHEITHILTEVGVKPIIKNKLINEGVAVAFDQSGKDNMAIAKALISSDISIKEMMNNSEALPDKLVYPFGGALITYLLRVGSKDQLMELIRNQTWENLISIYKEETIEKFEKELQK